MSTDATDLETTDGTARRGRPAGSRNRPKRERRNYAAEFAEFDNRISTTLRVLAKIKSSTHKVDDYTAALVDLAIETLTGE